MSHELTPEQKRKVAELVSEARWKRPLRFTESCVKATVVVGGWWYLLTRDADASLALIFSGVLTYAIARAVK